MDKTVCHIGPIQDNGGMASVIESITSMDIIGWKQTTINSSNLSSITKAGSAGSTDSALRSHSLQPWIQCGSK